MAATSGQRFGTGLIILTILIVVAGFLPWGQIRGAPASPVPLISDAFEGMAITITVWNGSISLGGLDLPNWLTVVAAFAVVGAYWLRELAVLAVPVALMVVIAAYGILHTLFAVTILTLSDEGSPGTGAVLSALFFVGMIVLLIRSRGPVRA